MSGALGGSYPALRPIFLTIIWKFGQGPTSSLQIQPYTYYHASATCTMYLLCCSVKPTRALALGSTLTTGRSCRIDLAGGGPREQVGEWLEVWRYPPKPRTRALLHTCLFGGRSWGIIFGIGGLNSEKENGIAESHKLLVRRWLNWCLEASHHFCIPPRHFLNF